MTAQTVTGEGKGKLDWHFGPHLRSGLLNLGCNIGCWATERGVAGVERPGLMVLLL